MFNVLRILLAVFGEQGESVKRCAVGCYRVLVFDVAEGEVAAEAGEAVAGEGADDDADNDISKVMLSDKYPADRHHEGPEEHPPSVGFEPFGHGRG